MENSFENKLKLCLDKLNRESDYEWKDIVRLLNLNMHPDNLRKMAYGYKEYQDYLDGLNLANMPKNDLEKLNQKLTEIKKEKVLLADQRKYTNDKIRSLARVEDFVGLFEEAIYNLNENKPLTVDYKYSNKDNDLSGILLLSDIHFGVDTENSINKYNPEIAIERMSNLICEVVKHCKTHNVNNLYVFELGDTLSGIIHNTIRYSNRLNITEQITKVAELLSEMLYNFSNALDSVTFTMVEGNHDRVFAKKDDNLNKDSYTTLVQEFIIERTKNIKNLNIVKTNCETLSYIDINGVKCVGVHGDKDSPKTAFNNIVSLLGVIPDYIFMGHFHNANEFTHNKSEIIVNGSFCGVDEYAYNLRKSSVAVQKFMIMNSKGRICTYNINLQ